MGRKYLFVLVFVLAAVVSLSVVAQSDVTMTLIKVSKNAWISSSGNSSATDIALFVAYASTYTTHSLLYFDVSSIPSGANIISAKLLLYKRSFNDLGSGKTYKTIYVYRLTASWVPAEATWTHRTSTKTWDTPGGDYTTEQGAWFNVKESDPWGYKYEIDVTDIVKLWVSGAAPNHGFILVPGKVWYGQVSFHSKFSDEEEYKPTLVVTYEYYVNVEVSSDSKSVVQGESAVFQISITAGGDVGNVQLSLSNAPPGVTYAFVPESGTPPFQSTLTIQTSPSTPPGTHNIMIIAQGAGVSDEYPIKLIVTAAGDFSIDVNPPSVTLGQGQTTQLQVLTTAKGGFSSPITLSISGLPNGVTATFSPNPVTPGAISTLTLQASSSAPPGTYQVKVKGKSSGLTRIDTFTLHIISVGFSVGLAPQSLTLSPGGSGTVTVTVTGFGGFSQAVTLTLTGAPPGVTWQFDPQIVSPGSTSILTIQVDPTVVPGTYELTIEGSGGGKSFSAPLTLIVEEVSFSLDVSPGSITVAQGGEGRVRIILSATGSLPSPVELSVSGLPSDATYELTSDTISPDEAVYLTVKVASTTPEGTYTITVEGVMGEASSTATFELVVVAPSFSLDVTPKSVTIKQGGYTTLRVTVTSTGALPSPVSLSVSNAPPGVSCTFSPSQLSPGSTGRLAIKVSQDAAPGDYVLVIQGVSGSVKETTQLTLTIIEERFDFAVKVTPESLELEQGESATVMVSVSLISGSARQVKLSLMGLPSGASYTFNPSIVTPPGRSTLEINAGSAKGTFTLTVVAYGDGVERTATITLTVKEKKCFIATATYGSELSDEVNALRRFRDNVVLTTPSGRAFYRVFDAFYYSWSPYVARVIAGNEALRTAMKVVLYPLVYSLSLAMSIAEPLIPLNSEVAVYLAGTISAALIGLFYFAPILLAAYLATGLRLEGEKVRILRRMSLLSLAICILSVVIGLDVLLSAATTMYALSIALLSSAELARLIVEARNKGRG